MNNFSAYACVVSAKRGKIGGLNTSEAAAERVRQKDKIKRTLYIKDRSMVGVLGLPGFLTLYKNYDTSPRDVNILEVLESLLNLYIKSDHTKNKSDFEKHHFLGHFFWANFCINSLNSKRGFK